MDQLKPEDIQFVALTKEEINNMIREAALVAAQVATDTLEKAHKSKKDRRLHNTKLLLRNYRTLKESCAHSVYQKTTETVEEVLGEIMTIKEDKVIVDSIRRSASKTAIMIEHIDKMLDIYRIYCSKYSEREKRQYKVIKMLYISKQKSTVTEIAKKFNVSKVTIYDDIKIAEERLTSLFFGVDGLHLL